MGRVKKYKKVKAMDPFAKGGGGGKMGRKRGDDLDRNLPPDVKNHQAQRLNNLEGGTSKKKNRRRLPQWAHDELKETSKRVREEHADPGATARRVEPQRPTIEGKREDESMRQFNKRVREGTAQLLRDEFKEHSSTNKRRKKYLDDKKRKNKLKKDGLWDEVQRRERIDEDDGENDGEAGGGGAGKGGGKGSILTKRGSGGGGGDGGRGCGGGGGGENWAVMGRADDEEGASFPGKERIRAHQTMGETRGAGRRGRGSRELGRPTAAGRRGGGGGGEKGGKDSGRGEGQGKGKGKKSGGGKLGGKEGGGSGEGGEEGRQQRQRLEEEAKKAQKRQMEEMRKRVQEAYSGLKKKRRAGQTQFVGSDL
eukprot:jgi/Undpi1/4126/HiC_scaffold_16.g07493.m1